MTDDEKDKPQVIVHSPSGEPQVPKTPVTGYDKDGKKVGGDPQQGSLIDQKE